VGKHLFQRGSASQEGGIYGRFSCLHNKKARPLEERADFVVPCEANVATLRKELIVCVVAGEMKSSPADCGLVP
jgi:hypothetical protein